LTGALFTMARLTFKEFKYSALNSDTIPIRLALMIGSIIWVLWAILASNQFPMFEGFSHDSVNDRVVIQCGVLFTAHVVLSWFGVFYNVNNRYIAAIGSGVGVIAWVSSALIITVSRLNEQALPMGGAHFITASMACWLFYRDLACFYYNCGKK